ncbi:MAG: 50S ribosomal protein L29 [Patescibacteria group bacterium]
MKRKEIENLKAKSSTELQKRLKESEELLSSSKFDLAAGKVKNIFLIKDTKKTIARIKTFIKERDLQNNG